MGLAFPTTEAGIDERDTDRTGVRIAPPSIRADPCPLSEPTPKGTGAAAGRVLNGLGRSLNRKPTGCDWSVCFQRFVADIIDDD